MTLQYDEWQVTQFHAESLRTLLEDIQLPHRELHVQRDIPGLTGGRLTSDFRAGMWMMPLRSKVGKQTSGRQDITYRSLLVAGYPNTSTQQRESNQLNALHKGLKFRFANRRVIAQPGELYSGLDVEDVDFDEGVKRKYEILSVVIFTTFRESR
jgi:hypothetical protein